MDFALLKPSIVLLLVALSVLQASPAPENPRNLAGAPYPSPPNERPRFSPFRPSIAVVVGVLTTMFSVTFLLLLYAKHCKRNSPFAAGAGSGAGAGAHYPLNSSLTGGRKNSGVDRAVIESLPVFRFGSLSGLNKDGLECAVCLSRFESSEVLRLLPKCKHAFHVECVDTWLDAHSTCPLCRYRVDPEDILLIDLVPPPPAREDHAPAPDIESGFFSRISGRHSSAGERVFQVIKETASFRRSLDRIGRVDRSTRKDGLLQCRERFEHRIIVSPCTSGPHIKRWSDVQPSDLLYLRSEMIMSDGRRFSSARRQGKRQESGDGRSVINSRSVSEITGVSRCGNDDVRQRQRQQAGLVSRWVTWLSQLRPPGGSDPNDP